MKKILFILGLIAILIAAIAVGFIENLFKFPIGQGLVAAAGLAAILIPLLIPKPEYGLAIVGFCLPFERFPTIELGGASLKLNYVLILLVLVSFLVSKILRREFKIPRDPIAWLVILFYLSLTFSFGVAVNLSRSIEVFLFMTLAVLVYFTVILVAQDKESLVLAVKGILWGAVAASLMGLYQFFGDMIGLPNQVTLLKEGYDKITFGFARVQAFSQEPLYFANYIFIPLLITVILLLRDKIGGIFNRTLAVVLAGALIIDFILAISRGAYLGAAVVFILFLIFQAGIIFRFKKLVPTLIIGVLILGGALALLLKSEPRALDEFISHIKVEDRGYAESVVARVNASEQALELFELKPTFGVGLGNFGPIIQNDPTEVPEGGWFIVNNEYLELMAENGIVGLLAFSLLIIALIIRGVAAFFKAKDGFLKALILGLFLALVGILVQYATFSTLYIFHIWFLIGLIGATCNVIFSQARENHETLRPKADQPLAEKNSK